MSANGNVKAAPYVRLAAYLAVGLRLWRAGPADAVVDGNLLHEGVLGGHREVRGLHLTEVELHGAVVTHDMRVKMLAAQLLFSHPESFGWLSAVLGVGQNHLIGVEILEKRHSDQI